MTAVRRYAEGTKVDAHKTKAELGLLLEKNGARDFGVGQMDGRGFVAFVLGARHIRMHVRIPTHDSPEITRLPTGRRWGEALTRWRREQAAQLERERWRRLLLLVKAKLEWVALGESTVEEEFMAHLLVGGRTVGEVLTAAKLDEIASGGRTLMLGPATEVDHG